MGVVAGPAAFAEEFGFFSSVLASATGFGLGVAPPLKTASTKIFLTPVKAKVFQRLKYYLGRTFRRVLRGDWTECKSGLHPLFPQAALNYKRRL